MTPSPADRRLALHRMSHRAFDGADDRVGEISPAWQPSRVLFAAVKISSTVIGSPPLASTASQIETFALLRAILTKMSSSSTVTKVLPSQSPVHRWDATASASARFFSMVPAYGTRQAGCQRGRLEAGSVLVILVG